MGVPKETERIIIARRSLGFMEDKLSMKLVTDIRGITCIEVHTLEALEELLQMSPKPKVAVVGAHVTSTKIPYPDGDASAQLAIENKVPFIIYSVTPRVFEGESGRLGTIDKAFEFVRKDEDRRGAYSKLRIAIMNLLNR